MPTIESLAIAQPEQPAIATPEPPAIAAPEPEVIATPEPIVPAPAVTAQRQQDAVLDTPTEWAQMYVPRRPDPVTVYIQLPIVETSPSPELSASADAPSAAAKIAPTAVADAAMPDIDAAVQDLPPASEPAEAVSEPVVVGALEDGRPELADGVFDQAADTIGDRVIDNPALDTEATSSESPFQDDAPSPTIAGGATPEWPFSIAALEIRLTDQALPDRTQATRDWPFASWSTQAFTPAFTPTATQPNNTLPAVEVQQPPEPMPDPEWGWRERLPGRIPADSLVFPEITRSAELHADVSRSADESPTQSPRILSEESAIRMTGGGMLSTVVPFHAPKPPGGKSISRWWLAPTLVLAVVVALFIFDYRAAVEKRGAIAPSGTPAADIERPATAAPTIGPRKTIELPGGRQLEARANGAIANLVTYLSEPGAAPGRAFVLDEVVFERDTSILTPLSEEQMRQVAQVMQAFPRTKARIESHTEASSDATGSRLITAERAATVKAALILLGVEDARLESRGMAAERPVATGDAPEDKARNRRIELILTSR